jgi:stage II sporulation protein D
MPRPVKTLSCSLCALSAGALLAAPVAPAATRLVVKGAGFGHGVGMSQYGAYGFALKGRSHEEILGHYYTGTRLSTLTSTAGTTVLLRASKSAAFTGATRIADRELDPAKTYSVVERGGTVVLRSPEGRELVRYGGPVRIAAGGAPVKLLGPGPNAVRDGRFRGELEFRPSGGALLVINALGLEDYVRGVVAGESPSGWPAEALRAQAVAARTYALSTSKNGNGFEQYSDTRSQVYNGVAGETPTTDAAVAATSRKVITFLGKPIVAYFFSTSGGKTENVENGFPGAAPQPYLKGSRIPSTTSPRATAGASRSRSGRRRTASVGWSRGGCARSRSPAAVSPRGSSRPTSSARAGPRR